LRIPVEQACILKAFFFDEPLSTMKTQSVLETADIKAIAAAAEAEALKNNITDCP